MTIVAADVPAVGALVAIRGTPALIGRDEQGVYAMTSTCTHSCCNVSSTGSGDGIVIRCPCHFSRFDRNGAVVEGPAEHPLAHFQVVMGQNGALIVQGGMQVSSDTRLAI